MAERVEEHLEQLIPVFELLKTVGLFSPSEVKQFVKRCRNLEYRLQKARKDPKDFLLYAEFLRNGLDLVRLRREKLSYKFKHNEIDGAMKVKIADVYKAVSLRFQGKKELWRERLNFLKKEKMRGRCSKAFFRALQIFGRDVKLREEAAFWEFDENRSVDNARLHLQLGLRLTPEAVSLWLCFFEIEIMNVRRLLERRKILSGEEKKLRDDKRPSSSNEIEDEESYGTKNIVLNESDPVLAFRLAEIVANEVLNSSEIPDKKMILFDLWKCAFKHRDIAEILEKNLYDKLWQPEYRSEESWMAQYERTPNQDPYDLLDKACAEFSTEKMLRYYIQVCGGRILLDDVYATIKCKELLLRLHEKGFTQIDDYKKLLSYGEDQDEKRQVLQASLERFPSSALLWAELLSLELEQDVDEKEMEKLFNDAEKKVEPKDSLIIYQLAIDWVIAKVPKKVDEVFHRAILFSCREVGVEVKCIRLRYCVAAFPDDPNILRDEYNRLCSSQPNSCDFHKTYINLEKGLKDSKHELIVKAFENCIAEFGCYQYECWIDYAKYLISTEPTSVSKLYQRALSSIPRESCDLFTEEWCALMKDSHSLNSAQCEIPLKRSRDSVTI